VAEKTGYEPGTPCWVDLTTPDVEGAAAFYSGLFGWEVVDSGPEFGGYRMCHLRGKPVAGIGPAQQPEIPPNWTSYVSVTDADVATKAITAAGGQVFVEPMDVPGTGRMGILADPGGAAFGVWQPAGFPGAALVTEPGALCWNELMTRHPDAAKSFYKAVFGWEGESQPMGEDDYTVWTLGGQQVAGMMPMGDRFPAEVPSYWLAYFAVEDADSTAARAGELGGQVTMPPTDIPVGRFAVLSDPAGAVFGVVKMNPMTAD
jgi:predicted enzyme related to lactoylglutathione lyase